MQNVSNPQEDDRRRGGKLLHVAHVAARLGVSPRTVRYWAEIGELPGFKIGLRQWRFREEDIIEYLEKKRAIA